MLDSILFVDLYKISAKNLLGFSSSPDLTLVHRVHIRAQWTVKVVGKLFAIAEWPTHPEHAGGVGASLDALLQRLVAILGAPRVGCGDPEHL